MPESRINIAETTDFVVGHSVLDDALRFLRIGGSLLLRERYSPPWAISIPDGERLGKLLNAAPGARVVAFHVVEFGHCEIRGSSDQIELLTAGEMAICFGSHAHVLAQGKARQAQSIESLLFPKIASARSVTSGQPPGAALLCGVLLLHDVELSPLFGALPPLIKTNLTRAGSMHNLSGVAQLLAAELGDARHGSGFIVERLLEVLCAEAIRDHIESAPATDQGWIRGIRDHVASKAIEAIHREPGAPWSVSHLAQLCNMSGSRFAARFTETVGESPMAYVARWRMQVACRRLAASPVGIEQIGAALGYESTAAFNRAFRRIVGTPPASWRARRKAC